ncbi:MAG: hypothetical protein K2Q18_18435, partial [Bdellovibrionales bacterium]|nr:hypothetical protein [Bdellovibrionales bacterium]
ATTVDTVVTVIANSSNATDPGDYSINTTTLTIPAGSTSASIDLTIAGDVTSREQEEMVRFTFTLPGTFTPNTIIHDLRIVDNDPLILTVNPFYPVNGANWNDYVVANTQTKLTRYYKNSALGFPVTDVECLANSGNCWHGGELKKVIVSDRTSCTNLSMQDSEDALAWRCQENGTLPIYFYSVGFKKAKGLQNFINISANDFKTLKVVLKENSSTVGESTLLKWWTNPIVKYDSGNINSTGSTRLNLNTAGTIYTFDGNLVTVGIDVNNSKIGLLVTTGSTLTSSVTFNKSTDCRPATGGVQACVLKVAGQSRVWIEGNFDMTSANGVDSGIIIDKNVVSNFSSRIHNTQLTGSNIILSNVNYFQISDFYGKNMDAGIYEDTVGYAVYNDIKLDSPGPVGISGAWLGMFSRYFNIEINHATSKGFMLSTMFNTLNYFKITNSNTGLEHKGNTNYISDGLLAGNNTGVLNSYTDNSTIGHISAVNNSTYGFREDFGNYLLLNNVLATNNNVGLLTGTMDSKHYNMYLIDNVTNEIQLPNGASDTSFFGNLRIGTGMNPCAYLGATTNAGVASGNCAQSGASSFALSTADSNTFFKGFTNDTLNLNGANGLSGFSSGSISDWLSFENIFRSWSKFDSMKFFPDIALSGRCSIGNCGIFDYSLNTLSPLESINGVFVENAPCPAITKGSNHILHNGNSFLQGAIEFVLDGYGNDNGLCEANERCYFNPGAGAMLREPWNFTKTCAYDPDGSALTGITIYGE